MKSIVVAGLELGRLRDKEADASCANPTHGSGWIVQVQPTKRRTRNVPFSSPSLPSRREGRDGEEKRRRDGQALCRLGLNDPHTAVWGIREFSRNMKGAPLW
jgi:hypothetical protein